MTTDDKIRDEKLKYINRKAVECTNINIWEN